MMNDVLILNITRVFAAFVSFYGCLVLLRTDRKIRHLGLELRLMMWFTVVLCLAASCLIVLSIKW